MKEKHKTLRDIAAGVVRDFEKRREVRRQYELQWQLNIDFMHGRQNNRITSMDAIAAGGKRYYWQQNEVYNHISPLIETRLAKLTDDVMNFRVVPQGDGEKDRLCAEKCEKVIKAAFKRLNMPSLADQANMWAEMTGTAFYKVIWDSNGGRISGFVKQSENGRTSVGDISDRQAAENGRTSVGSANELSDERGEGNSGNGFVGEAVLRSGDVRVVVCSPFEIYPDNLCAGDIEQVGSLIHAKPYSVSAIKKIWGIDVAGGDVEVHDFNRNAGGAVGGNGSGMGILKDAATVIERYQDGELVIVAGGKLLYRGAYDVIPFVRQTSESVVGSFYGRSVIERAIPVQRAYNAVKNRKTEFLNRLACGVLAVEEHSTDVEALENDGLAPGTLITYRQGANPPKFMESGVVPIELEKEEERLLSELGSMTGGSDISRGDSGDISGVALEIMVEQDKLRVRRSVQSSRNARAAVASKMLGLYKKYAGAQRLERLANGKNVELFTFSAADVLSEEVEIDNG